MKANGDSRSMQALGQIMQEVLSKGLDLKELRDGAQFYELCLDETGAEEKPVFWVTETCFQWDATNQLLMRDGPQLISFETYDEAQACYQRWRQALTEKGFIYSDMRDDHQQAGKRPF